VIPIFKLRANASVFSIERVISTKDGPMALNRLYTHPRYAARLPADKIGYTPLIELIEEHCRVEAVRTRQVATALAATPHMATMLGIRPGSPLAGLAPYLPGSGRRTHRVHRVAVPAGSLRTEGRFPAREALHAAPLRLTERSYLARPSVRITRVETIALHVPFHDPFLIAAGPARPVAEVLLVRLHTDAGLQGVGETQAWRRVGSSETLPGMVAAIRNHFERCIVVGRSPFRRAPDPGRLRSRPDGCLYPKAAVADALLDLQARALDVPAWHLLGGKMRDTLAGSGGA
jgi:hypothetical protein